ncbi:MAG: hypothetical protein KY466_04160 [Gemmatimonadetes bacterium]|nr:hypothetical protein [Gemmatimonadota bacterium]
MGRSTAMAAVLALLPFHEVAAQASVLHLGAGRSGYEALQTFSTSMMAGFSYAPDAAGWTSISVGVPLSPGEDPSWLAGAAERMLGVALGPVGAGLDLSLEGFGYRDPSSGVVGMGGTVGALPALRLDRPEVGLRVRSGVRAHGAQSAGYSESRAVHHTDLTLEARLRRTALAGVEARYVRSAEGATPFLGGYVTLRHSAGELRADLGRWLGDLVEGTSWSVQANIGLARGVSLTGGAAHQGTDPLYLYEGRTSWSVGMSMAVGAGNRLRPTLPVVPRGAGVRIAVPAAGIDGPLHVAGEFSRWELVPMKRVEDEWVLELSLETGAYRYAVRDGHGRWFVPETAYRRSDGMGGEVAFIIVAD